jgi:hypothetical protein
VKVAVAVGATAFVAVDVGVKSMADGEEQAEIKSRSGVNIKEKNFIFCGSSRRPRRRFDIKPHAEDGVGSKQNNIP